MIKNIDFCKTLELKNEVSYLDNQIVSKIITQNKHHSMTLFALYKNQEIATHTTTGDALVQILDGTAKITIGENEYIVKKDESIIMPANIPHSLYANENFKFLLTVIYEPKE